MSTQHPAVPASAPARRRGIPLPFGLTPYAAWFLAILVASWLVFRVITPEAVAFKTEALQNLGTVLAPLVLIAAFVERAVEVVVTPLRGDEAERLQADIDERQKNNQDTAELEKELREHKLRSRHFAFLLAVALGLIASLLGVRGLGSLLVEPPANHSGLQFFDVVLTGVVIGGGADGIHKPVKAFTDYMSKISKSARTP